MAPVSAKSGGSVSALAALLRRRPKLWLAAAVAVVLLVLYPLVIGGIVAHAVASRIGARLGRPVTIAQGRGGLGRFVLRGFTVGDAPSADGKTVAKSGRRAARHRRRDLGPLQRRLGRQPDHGRRPARERGSRRRRRQRQRHRDAPARQARRRRRRVVAGKRVVSSVPGVRVESGTSPCRTPRAACR